MLQREPTSTIRHTLLRAYTRIAPRTYEKTHHQTYEKYKYATKKQHKSNTCAKVNQDFIYTYYLYIYTSIYLYSLGKPPFKSHARFAFIYTEHISYAHTWTITENICGYVDAARRLIRVAIAFLRDARCPRRQSTHRMCAICLIARCLANGWIMMATVFFLFCPESAIDDFTNMLYISCPYAKKKNIYTSTRVWLPGTKAARELCHFVVNIYSDDMSNGK